MSSDATAQRVSEKIHLLEALKPDYAYPLLPVVDIVKITDVEKQLKKNLPSEYRSFLLNVGNGDSNKGCGLLSLEETVSLLVKNDLFADPNEMFKAPARPDAFEFEAGLCGVLPISKEGTVFHLLIITGDEAGNIWTCDQSKSYLVPAIINPILSFDVNEQRYSFFSWYEAWLDYSLTRLQQQ